MLRGCGCGCLRRDVESSRYMSEILCHVTVVGNRSIP